MQFSTLLNFTTPHRGRLVLVVLLLLGGSGISLMQPWLAGQLAAVLLGSEAALLTLQSVMVLWVSVLLLRSVIGFATQYTIGSLGEQMTAKLRSRLYEHLQALPLGYHQQQRSGDTLSLLANDADVISEFVTDTLVQLLPLLLTFVGACVLMVLIDPVVAGLAILLLPAYFLVMKIVGRRIRPLSRAWIDAYRDVVSLVTENLGMLPALKAFTREPVEQQRFEARNQQLLRASRRQILVQALLDPVIGLMAGLGLLLMLWIGSLRIASGDLSPADLVSLLLYAMLMSQPLRSLANVYGQVQRARGSSERILAFLGQSPEPDDTGKRSLPRVRGAIRFDKIRFSYPGRDLIFDAFDLDIPAGQTVAITGRNGAGKSTLAHLLLRFADPDAGRIFVDGIDTAGVTMQSLRSQIGLVAQHVLLLNGSVAENIAYGRPVASHGDIEQAARRAHAHDFIAALPDAYETVIGDQGFRLSGGQRQRIALARALLLNPPILVFDEATAMFDPDGEASFIDECRTLLADKTVILITHRPGSLALADRIVELT